MSPTLRVVGPGFRLHLLMLSLSIAVKESVLSSSTALHSKHYLDLPCLSTKRPPCSNIAFVIWTSKEQRDPRKPSGGSNREYLSRFMSHCIPLTLGLCRATNTGRLTSSSISTTAAPTQIPEPARYTRSLTASTASFPCTPTAIASRATSPPLALLRRLW